MEKIRRFFVYLNMWRILPVYLFFKTNRFRDKCDMDLEQWVYYFSGVANKGRLFQMGYLLLYHKACRNILLNRLRRNVIMYAVTSLLFKPLESCYINMPPEKIGGGLSFQHGFSTIIAAEEIGQRCRIYQQVTIGYKDTEAPVIGDDVVVSAGAIVIGGIQIENCSRVGAGAVVTKDVPPHATVVGVPARVLKISQL